MFFLEQKIMETAFYCYLSMITSILCLGLFFCSSKLSHFISSTYLQLSFKDKINWNTRITSNIHAVVVTSLALYAFFYDEATLADSFWYTNSIIVRIGISITFGFIFTDLLIILWYYDCFQEINFIIHHLMVLLAYYFVVGKGYLLFFANIRQIAELSTPFVNQRWFYHITGQPRHSRLFVQNGIIMVFAFFLGRIVFIPYFYFKTLSVWSDPKRIALGPVVSFLWIFTTIVLDVLNIFWFFKMIQGCVKLFFPYFSTKSK
ncbi:TLC domain-containing protein 4-like [Xenia sp. Carnegie-2017]|uniref:TLC domain-containing protein 4-like n=1 Tax=Xenia sp. Carnegie-2017 TaxID=2897299 RepID=UPI001F0495A7|nr:TLC domain-containing protein 4-like [Xenia sp. Carnegie-2017]